MSLTERNVCEKCDVRLPKNRPKLICAHCLRAKHYSCQKLSKADAWSIIDNKAYDWICYECFADMLPVNAPVKISRSKPSTNDFKAKCQCCGGQSYSPKNLITCPWCSELSHQKCVNNSLGCNNCCDKIIPGFRVHNYELYDRIGHNKSIFNPYNQSNFSNLIGDRIANEEENNVMWNEISEFLIRCKYKQPKNIRQPKSDELNVMSLNIRSIHKNLPHITDNISDYQKYDVICFNETNCNFDKLANGISDLHIEGFHPPIIQAPAHSTCRGGGLATYVNKNVCSIDEFQKIDIDSDSESRNIDGEFLFVKINQCKGINKSLIIGNVYRSPSSKHNNFIDLLETKLRWLDRHSNKHILLLGDFNTDHIKNENDINSQNLIDITTQHGFLQIISRPTRITDHSATLIDHIYTNKINNVISSNVLTLDLSDHLATFATISLDKEFDSRHRREHKRGEHFEYRMFNEANNEQFREHIINENWDEISDEFDAQTQYEKFSEIYTKHYNAAYPLNTKRNRRKNERLSPKPWILPWLEDACNRKNKLYHAYVKNPTVANKVKYLKMKKFTDKHINLAKSKYYKKYFEEYKQDSKKQWQMINNLLNRKTKNSGVPKLLDNSGNVINKPVDIAEKFNDYFVNIASNLKSQINSTRPTNTPNYLFSEPSPNSMYVNPVEPSEICDIINNLKNKATLDTKISALKIANTDIKFTQVFAKVTTSSFNQGVFPQSLKTARVVPIHKNGAKTDVSNYRPISLLTSFSKIYEKLMHNRIANFMDSNNSFYEMQYGFRSGRSCEHALLKAQSILLDNLSKNQISLLLFIDFSKAFDMVDHSILLQKLSHYGIRGTALNWLKSYLENREQFVSINGKDSSKKLLKYGVPQGSILGPLLFIIYINDIPEIQKFAKFILYADDANIILTGKNMKEIEEQAAELSTALMNWVDSNGLALNLKKTNYMIFSRQKIDNYNFKLVMANAEIHRKTEARFLGVIVDEKLNWTRHIMSLKSKMSKYVGIMYKIKNLLPSQIRLQIFHSFVQAHINFCSLVWGFSAKTNIDALFASQKKGMRAVMPGYVNFSYQDGALPSHTKPYFNQFNVLTVQGVIAKNVLIFMNKIRNFPQLLPISIRETIASEAPGYGSTHETCIEWQKKYGGFCYNKSIFYKGPLMSIDPNFSQLSTDTNVLAPNAYKNNIKRILLQLQAEGNTIEWQMDNFPLYTIPGLRRSARLNQLED